ncbi:hypothetical protein D910_10066, partial [Dendroctonus ponderosae]
MSDDTPGAGQGALHPREGQNLRNTTAAERPTMRLTQVAGGQYVLTTQQHGVPALAQLLKEKYAENLLELFYLETGGNILDLYQYAKRPKTSDYVAYLKEHAIDAEEYLNYSICIPYTTPSTPTATSASSLPGSSFNSTQSTTPVIYTPSSPASVVSDNLSSIRMSTTSNSTICTSQEQIVEKAKQEAYVVQRVNELQKEGLWSEKRLPKIQEMPRCKAHWDYLLEEMVWLAADFAQERKWKKAAAKKCARMVQKYFQDKSLAALKAAKAQEQHLRRIASFCAKEVKLFWCNVEKLVEYKQNTILEEKRKRALDQQLSFIVDQTEKYSQLLAEGMNKSAVDLPSAKVSGQSALKHQSDDEFDPHEQSEEDDEETIAQEEAALGNFDQSAEVEALQRESQLELDDLLEDDFLKDYLLNRDNIRLSGSDDSDMESEEKKSKKSDPESAGSRKSSNKAASEKESKSDSSESDDDLDSDDESNSEELTNSQVENQSLKLLMGDLKTEGERAKTDEKDALINDAAAIAESIQPKGNTLSSTTVSTKVPFLLKLPLREYQHIGLEWLVTMYDRKLNGILADEMGLGKTIQTIALLAHLACEKENWGPHLIVVPTSVMLNWEMECKKWCPAFKILTYYGSQKERKMKRTGWTKPNMFHICITSYKLVIQDHQSFRRKKWKYLILDEAQNIKNFKSQRWQLLLNFQTERRLLLTGTPLQNNLMELWSLMHFLMPNVFQSHREFKEWFSNPVTGMIEGNSEYNESIIKRLHKVLRPFLLRRLKSEVEKQMPKKYEHVVMCRLSKRQRFLYDDYMSRANTRETLASGNLLSVINVLMQLRKVCNHPNLFEVRPTISPFQCENIEMHVPSIVYSAINYDVFKNVDLYALNLVLIMLEMHLGAYQCYRLRQSWKKALHLDQASSQQPLCPPCKLSMKVKVRDIKQENKEMVVQARNVSNAQPNVKMKVAGLQVLSQGVVKTVPLINISQAAGGQVQLGTPINVSSVLKPSDKVPTSFAQLVQTSTGKHLLLTSNPNRTGSVPVSQATAVHFYFQVLMERFNGDKRIFAFILSTRSGGVGVNLTGADTVVFYDSDWNPTMDAQAQDRCHRIGQTRDVHIYRLVSERTIEENILKKANQKRLLGDLAIEGGNFTTAYFKSTTIQDLFNIDQTLETAAQRMSEIVENSREVSATPIDTAVVQSEDKSAAGALETALAACEDDQDVQAAKIAKAEAVADLAEFDENIPLEQDSEREPEVVSKAEQEINNIIKKLSPIEKYAMKFIEQTESAWSAEQLAAAARQIEEQKREWEEQQMAAMREEEERRQRELEEENDMITYSREDATNQVSLKHRKHTRFRKVFRRTKAGVKVLKRKQSLQTKVPRSKRLKRLASKAAIIVKTDDGGNSSDPVEEVHETEDFTEAAQDPAGECSLDSIRSESDLTLSELKESGSIPAIDATISCIDNHVDHNSPRTRSRGTVAINLWTLDVSPILPSIKRIRNKVTNSSIDHDCKKIAKKRKSCSDDEGKDLNSKQNNFKSIRTRTRRKAAECAETNKKSPATLEETECELHNSNNVPSQVICNDIDTKGENLPGMCLDENGQALKMSRNVSANSLDSGKNGTCPAESLDSDSKHSSTELSVESMDVDEIEQQHETIILNNPSSDVKHNVDNEWKRAVDVDKEDIDSFVSEYEEKQVSSNAFEDVKDNENSFMSEYERELRKSPEPKQENNCDNASTIVCPKGEFYVATYSLAIKRLPTTRTVVNNPLMNKTKNTPVLNECGIDLEHPLLPFEIAAKRAERIAKEKKALTPEQLAKLQMLKAVSQQQQAQGAVSSSGSATSQSASGITTVVTVPTTHVIVTSQAPIVVTTSATIVTPSPGAPLSGRPQRIIASPLQTSTVVSVSGLSPAQLQAATQRLIVTGGAAKAVTSATGAQGKQFSPAQLQMIRQAASLKNNQFRLHANSLAQASKASTVTIAGQQAVVQFSQAQPRGQFVRQGTVTVGGKTGVSRTVTDSEVAQLLKKQQQLQQQKMTSGTISQPSNASGGNTIHGLTTQVFAQAIQQAGTPGAQVATLVKAVPSSGATQTVTIPVSGVTLAASGAKAIAPSLKPTTAQQLRHMQIQQQLMAQKKLAAAAAASGQKLSITTSGSKGSGVQTTQLIVGAKQAMTVQQFQQVIRTPINVGQGPVVLTKGSTSRVIPVNAGQGTKQTIQVVAASSQALSSALRPQGSTTIAGIKLQSAGNSSQQALLSQVTAALNQNAVRQNSPVRLQTASGQPIVAATGQSSTLNAQSQSHNVEQAICKISYALVN